MENLNETNITTNITNNDIPASYVIFLVNMVICVLMGIGTIFGNLIVIVTITRKKSSGIFRYVNEVVRNLAITDALFGLVGVPLTMVYWYWGKLQVSNHTSIEYHSIVILKLPRFDIQHGANLSFRPIWRNGND